ncbi:MAG: phosphoglycerate kinase [Bdellovibrionaceae bacterium]|nr:phosphoglycerate kinase [Pseudobdellovibrionaceae bacterium]
MPFVESLALKGKNVFIRVDFNVPIVDGQITDDSRIQGALETIRYVRDQGAKVILGSHFGRPKTEEDRKKLSLEPVAQRLQELLDCEVVLVEEPLSEAPKALLKTLREHQVLMLENLRFFAGETKNEKGLVEAISAYTDVYINDAFGASHRAHSSIVGLPATVSQKAMGFLMKKELEALNGILSGAESPYVAVLGGAKVSDKITIIKDLMNKVDGFIIGGAMAYTFLKAQGNNVGTSLVEKEQIQFAKKMIEGMEAREKKLLLPVDHVVAPRFDAVADEVKTTDSVVVPEGFMGLDIGPQTIKTYAEYLGQAKTIFWNGPMGVFENELFNKGTFAVAEAIAKSEAVSIVGGGDSASAARESGFSKDFTHISTGGGASLEYLQGVPMPGLLALQGKFKDHIVK